MIFSDDVEDFRAVCEQALDDLQHIVSEVGNAQLVNEYFQPFLCGKLTAILAIASNHGSQKFVHLMLDSINGCVVLHATLLAYFNDF